MYRAKADGRGRWELFDQAMRERVAARLRLQDDLRKAAGSGEFRVHYHPIVELPSGALGGFEASLRWRGLIIPVDVLSMAEEAGWIVRIGDWLLREACMQAGAWHRRHLARPGLRLSVHVAGVQFQRPELVREMTELLRESGLPARALTLEVTEETVLSETETAQANFAGLEALGVGLVLDRFGSGDASLRALRRYALHAVKLDPAMVATLEGDAAAASMVPAIVQLASALGLPVGASGIETAVQAEALRAVGCSFGQGMLFSDALDASGAEALLASPVSVAHAAPAATGATSRTESGLLSSPDAFRRPSRPARLRPRGRAGRPDGGRKQAAHPRLPVRPGEQGRLRGHRAAGTDLARREPAALGEDRPARRGSPSIS